MSTCSTELLTRQYVVGLKPQPESSTGVFSGYKSQSTSMDRIGTIQYRTGDKNVSSADLETV